MFDPMLSRIKEEEFGLNYALNKTYDEKKPMGNVAQSTLGHVILLWLVGFYKETALLVPRLLTWLDEAIAKDEDFGGRELHRQTLHWAKALGLWMLDGNPAKDIWDQVQKFNVIATANPDTYPKSQLGTYRLDDYLAFCYQAEAYEQGMAAFEECHGKKEISLKKTLKPREFGYALCCQSFDEKDLLMAGRKMLQANLQENWLGKGQNIRAATWLKIVYWHHDRSLTPVQVILNAYDDMPEVPRPAFIDT